jgi:hypothetical protein
VPPEHGGKAVPHERLWLVVQGDEAAEGLRTGAVFRALVPLKQSFEPRVIRAADQPAAILPR